MTDAGADRLRVDYTSAIDDDTRIAVVDAVHRIVMAKGYYSTQHYDKVSAAWTIEVTKYDPNATHPITDAQVADYLKSIAAERGISVSDILREAKRNV